MIDIQADYRKQLEKTAKLMILVHRVDTLVKIILRTIVKVLSVDHASLLLYDESRDAYVAHTSLGKPGLKVPKGFARISKDDPVIKYFVSARAQKSGEEYLLLSQLEAPGSSLRAELVSQFQLYNATACIPGFFRNRLIFALFLGKKMDNEDFSAEELSFMSVLASDAVMAIQNAWLFQDLEEQLLKNKNLFLQTVFAFSSAIEAKDPYTQGHTERVTQYSLAVAMELKAMGKIPAAETKSFYETLRISSLLHDIGKIGIPESILHKNSMLDNWEREEIKKHALIGANILNKVNEFSEPTLGVKYHHERFDGQGYPEGLKGDQIPLIAQIIAVVDTFDAMTSARPYREVFSKQEALRLIEEQKNKQFDPAIVQAFISAYLKGKI